MTLGDLLETMKSSDMLIITCGGGEVYRGYVGCTQHIELPTEWNVEKCELGMEVTVKTADKSFLNWRMMRQEKGAPVTKEEAGRYSFSDMAIEIYFKVRLAGTKALPETVGACE